MVLKMNSWKKTNKRILFGISGGIAAYKAPDILHGLIKAGCEVEVIMTKAAEAFVSPLAISTLTHRSVWKEEDFFDSKRGWKIPHISLTEWADVFVVAPATANIIKVCATGDASTLMGAAFLACTKPIIFFPAMNSNMLSNPATICNIDSVRRMGHTVIESSQGLLACGVEGKGRLPSNYEIYEHIWKSLSPKCDLLNKNIMITAGPTHEYIDPVRYISNPSSGKMGYAIARAAWYRGANVTLITGPVSIPKPVGINVISVVTAEEMYRACMDCMDKSDIIVKSAAVGDFRTDTTAKQKIKRTPGSPIMLNLVQNKDIAAELGKIKRDGQILVGFAAETDHLIENANKKIESKNLDYVAVNNVLDNESGFACNTNSVTFISANGQSVPLSGSKDDVADGILNCIVEGM